MRLLGVDVERSGRHVVVRGLIEAASRRLDVYFQYPEEFEGLVSGSADAFVPALLLPCLETGEDLAVEPPVSGHLLSRLHHVQELMLSWHPSFRPVRVHATAAPAARGAGPFTATLFSGGVDSFFTLHRSASRAPGVPPVSHLLFVRGLEQPLSVTRGDSESVRQVQEYATAAGKTLVVGETNLRDRFGLNYQLYYHGAALAAAALTLGRGLSRVLVPSSSSYGQLKPWGTHPLLDPLWSTEATEFSHDGAGWRRVDKLAVLAQECPEVFPRLRVCLKNDGGAYNCGRCLKCIRTMVALTVLGRLEAASSFPDRLPPDLARLLATEKEQFLVELSGFARSRNGPPELVRQLEASLAKLRRRRAIRDFAENTPVVAGIFALLDSWRRSGWPGVAGRAPS